MFCIMECQIHKKVFKATVGFPVITELDPQHENAPQGCRKIVYSVGHSCPLIHKDKNNDCEMDKWKYIKEINEGDYNADYPYN